MRRSKVFSVILRTVIVLCTGVGLGVFFISQFALRSLLTEGIDATIILNDKIIPNNLLFLPGNRIVSELKNDYPQFADIRLEKKWPDTVIVHFVSRTPIALLTLDKRSIAVDTEGYVLGDSSDTLLPRIIIPYLELQTGKRVENPAVTLSLAFLSEMGQDDGIREIRIGADRSVVVRMQEMIIYLDLESDGKNQAWTLQRLLAGLRIKGSLPKSIDLRFAKPVVQL